MHPTSETKSPTRSRENLGFSPDEFPGTSSSRVVWPLVVVWGDLPLKKSGFALARFFLGFLEHVSCVFFFFGGGGLKNSLHVFEVFLYSDMMPLKRFWVVFEDAPSCSQILEAFWC